VPSTPIRVEVNGSAASAGQLQDFAFGHYGHFTAMQVRQARTRGLDLHLARLAAATRELFGRGLDGDEVRAHIRHALGETRDASVRVIVYWPEPDPAPDIMVTVRPPAQLSTDPQRLLPVPYQRPVPHIKHIGDVGQAYYGRLAEREGFDDALLTGADGSIAEGAITNIAFSDGSMLTWPDAPCLAGISWQLVEPRLASAGLATQRGPVRLAGLASYTAAIVTNSHGVAPVGWIGQVELPGSAALSKAVGEIYESVPWDPI
jgi:branched-subunit amino acid aminotransferase/4-amino-4-deoxychorismate lyase